MFIAVLFLVVCAFLRIYIQLFPDDVFARIVLYILVAALLVCLGWGVYRGIMAAIAMLRLVVLCLVQCCKLVSAIIFMLDEWVVGLLSAVIFVP